MSLLAAVWRRAYPDWFGDAYATASGEDVAPFPVTARTCSAAPGFLANGRHGVTDIAIRQAVFEQAKNHPELLLPFELRCPRCGAPWIACEGLLLRRGVRDYAILDDLTQPSTTEHRPISRARRRAEELFRQDGVQVPRSAYYAARLDVPEALDGTLRTLLADGLIVGGRRTRGMGAVRAELVPRPDPALTLRERIGTFNRALRAEQRFYTVMTGDPLDSDEGHWHFTLDFKIQAAYTKQPAPLADIRGLRDVTIMHQWLKPTVSGGRNLVTGMPISSGLMLIGTALCRVPPDADRTALEQALGYLETHGVGQDRVGSSVSVCDPFHLEIEVM